MKRKKSGNKNVETGLAEKHIVTPALQTFLQKHFDIPLNTPVARTTITKLLNQYIKNNNLQDNVNKKQIVICTNGN